MKWYKQKTTWTGVAAAIAAIGGYFTDQASLVPSVQLFFTALIGIFLRQGVSKMTQNGSK